MLTAEQARAVDLLVTGARRREPLQTLGGFAGVGKSLVVAALHRELPDFAVCAFTGKAADVLRRKGVKTAATIHSLIYHPQQAVEERWVECERCGGTGMVDKMVSDGYGDTIDADTCSVCNGNKGKTVRKPGKVVFTLRDDVDFGGFLVDEASMVGEELYDDMRSFDLPIIAVGDHGQLEPIMSKLNLMAKPQITLEHIHRNAGDVARFAEHLRRGGSAMTFGDSKVVKVLRSPHDADVLAADQAICAYNRFRCAVNLNIRERLGFRGPLQPGERVMCLRNDREMGLFNGMQGVVKAVRGNVMDFESDGRIFQGVPFDPDQFGKEKYDFFDQQDRSLLPFDWAWCCTVHKYQGSESDHVLVFQQQCRAWDMKRWNYTAASRAKKQLTWVAG